MILPIEDPNTLLNYSNGNAVLLVLLNPSCFSLRLLPHYIKYMKACFQGIPEF